MFMNLTEFFSFCIRKLFKIILNIVFSIVLNTVMKKQRDEPSYVKSDVGVNVHHWYNNINSQLDAAITNFIDNYNQLNMFRAIILPILRSTRLCLQLVV